MNEAFAKILDLLNEGRGPTENFRAYLLRTISNLHVDHVRGNSRVRWTDDFDELPLPGLAIVDGADARAEGATILRAFASLPESWRTALWFAEVEGESLDQLAERLDSNANAVAVLNYRAREGLRAAYLAEHAGVSREECRKYAVWLPKHVRGGLHGRKAERLSEHLEGCRECRGAVLELSSINTHLRSVLAPLGIAVVGSATTSVAGTGAGVIAGLKSLAMSVAGKTVIAVSVVGIAATGGVVVMTNQPAVPPAERATSASPPDVPSPEPVERETRPSRKAQPKPDRKPKPVPTSRPEPVPTMTATTPVPTRTPTPTPTPVVTPPPAPPSPMHTVKREPLTLRSPSITTVRTGEIASSSFFTAAGPGDGELTLVITLTNVDTYRLKSAADAWTCSDGVRRATLTMVCSNRRQADSAPIGFAVEATSLDPKVRQVGRVTVSDHSDEVARTFTVAPVGA